MRSARITARKIPQFGAAWPLVLFAAVFVQGAGAQPVDTTRLHKAAERAEADYEYSIRRFAPWLGRATPAGECDEVIGRYCITFDTGRRILPPEPTAITVARESAIAALNAAFAVAPDRPGTAFPLVRFLVRAARAHEAVDVARAHARARGDAPEGAMLLGYALHEARRTDEARDAFDVWLARLPDRDRARVESTEWISSARDDQRKLLWRYADPLYITPGNELWTEHVSRHALSRMLKVRRASPAGSWGTDDEQLTVRFGYPFLTTRSWRSGSMGMNDQVSDHWDPTQRTYVPPQLDSALSMPARVDSIWPLDSLTSRSGHAPPTIRLMRVLEHQAVRSGDRVRITGVVRTDSLVENPLAGMVFLLDSALNIVAQKAWTCSACPVGDSAVIDLTLAVPANAWFYSAELYDPVSRFAARARYRLDPVSRTATIALSGLRIEATRPVVEVGSRLGLTVEVTNLTTDRRTVRIELETKSLDRPSVIVRAAGWVGEKLGLSSRQTPARLGWNLDVEGSAVTAVPLTVGLGDAAPGRYRVTMTVTDPGGSNVVWRDFLVISGASSSRRP